VRDANGNITCWTGVNLDITERKRHEEQMKASVAEKENLLRELSHRTKNNMQVIVGLLNLQATRSNDDRVTNALGEAQNRIHAMALVHEKLYRGGSISSLNIKEYAEGLANNLLKSHQGKKGLVRLVLDLEEIPLPHDMVLPSGLIINELISNSLKHAFPNGKSGSIYLSIKVNGEKLELRYKDDGPGLPRDFGISRIETLGLKLVRSLALYQLRGTIELAHHMEGTEFVFRFPLQK
jgi:two-component sensor histidine kinase